MSVWTVFTGLYFQCFIYKSVTFPPAISAVNFILCLRLRLYYPFIHSQVRIIPKGKFTDRQYFNTWAHSKRIKTYLFYQLQFFPSRFHFIYKTITGGSIFSDLFLSFTHYYILCTYKTDISFPSLDSCFWLAYPVAFLAHSLPIVWIRSTRR